MEKEEENSTLNNFQASSSKLKDGVNTWKEGTDQRINIGDKIRTQITVTPADSVNHSTAANHFEKNSTVVPR